jgi:hypothetical protein
MRDFIEELINELLDRGFKEPWLEFQVKIKEDNITLRFRTFGYVFIRDLVLFDNDLERLKNIIRSKIKTVVDKTVMSDKLKGINSRIAYTEQEIYTSDEIYLFYSCERKIEFFNGGVNNARK